MASHSVPLDSFICGVCSSNFNDLVTFLEHKRSTSCGVTVSYNAAANEENLTVLAEATDVESSPHIKVIKKKVRRKKEDSALVLEPRPDKTASMGTDGLLCCDTCKLKFSRDRHFRSHKCKHQDELYVAPEDIPELNEGHGTRRRVSSNQKSQSNISLVGEDDGSCEKDTMQAEKEIEEGEQQETGAASKRRYIVGSDPKKKLASLSSKRKIATYPIPQTLDDIPDVPVFPNEEARREFEKKEITVVDLSSTYDMYKTHLVEQTMNENAVPVAPRNTSDISLYSCNECEKVFKSLSHIRYHCLTHIDKKPFKCPECDFRSNSKGNIYSHMRKHTGQMYRCRTCEFKSVNKSHLLEHEATHSGVVHKCALCSKHYSTVKSLINHVRNYHSKTEEGKAYHQQFVQAKEGPGAAMLFECHICDRKFKKQSDRDRHLYIHNVRVEHTIFSCELCDYETSKQIHLDLHYVKHRYAYGCHECGKKSSSTVTLVHHLNTLHPKETPYDHIPLECIQKSLYLPEDRQTVLKSSSAALSISRESTSDGDIFTRLGYEPMTKDLYDKFREDFGSHECEECGLLFHTQQACDDHVLLHQGEKPFACEYCNHKAHSKNSIKLHVNAHHEDKLFRCDLCDFVSRNKVALIDHRNRHESLQCPICQQHVAGRKGLRNHLLGKHAEVDAETARKLSGYGRRTDIMKSGKAFKCPYCDKMFTNNNIELQKHIWVHEGIKPFKCDICDYSCRTRSNLNSHMLRHTEQKPFPCTYCGKRYKSKTALRWHERSHANGRLFKCDKCDYEGIQKSHLIRHMETHNILKRFSCNHCDFSANTVGYMRIHYTRSHPGIAYTQNEASQVGEQAVAGTTSTGTPSNVFKCVSCDYIFGNLSDMKRHLRHRHRIHMNDIRVVTGQDVVTEIVPMENQDGITSDVQVMRFPMDGASVEGEEAQIMQVIAETDVENGETFVDPGDFDGNIRLVDNLHVEGGEEDMQTTVVMDYPSDPTQVVSFSTLGDSNSQLFLSAPVNASGGVKPGISLLKNSRLSIQPQEETTLTIEIQQEDIEQQMECDVTSS